MFERCHTDNEYATIHTMEEENIVLGERSLAAVDQTDTVVPDTPAEGLTNHMNRYGGDISKCPVLRDLGESALAIIQEEVANIENEAEKFKNMSIDDLLTIKSVKPTDVGTHSSDAASPPRPKETTISDITPTEDIVQQLQHMEEQYQHEALPDSSHTLVLDRPDEVLIVQETHEIAKPGLSHDAVADINVQVQETSVEKTVPSPTNTLPVQAQEQVVPLPENTPIRPHTNSTVESAPEQQVAGTVVTRPVVAELPVVVDTIDIPAGQLEPTIDSMDTEHPTVLTKNPDKTEPVEPETYTLVVSERIESFFKEALSTNTVIEPDGSTELDAVIPELTQDVLAIIAELQLASPEEQPALIINQANDIAARIALHLDIPETDISKQIQQLILRELGDNVVEAALDIELLNRLGTTEFRFYKTKQQTVFGILDTAYSRLSRFTLQQTLRLAA